MKYLLRAAEAEDGKLEKALTEVDVGEWMWDNILGGLIFRGYKN